MTTNFHIITFGCQMNFNDSDWLSRALGQRGLQESPLDKAHIIIINTCSVREKPEQKVYNTLRKVRHESRNTKGAFVVVAGCVAQQIGDEFFAKFPEVRIVSGGDGIAHIPDAIDKIMNEPSLKVSLIDFSDTYAERSPEFGIRQAAPISYVNIMQGCDNFCAYCIVPYTRGRQKSRSTNSIIAECQKLIEHGAKELCLLGQNVNSFGQDASGDGTSFTELLYAVAKLPNLVRLRFVTPHPKDFSPELIKAFGELEVLSPHLHLPLQAGSDTVLRDMGRKYDRARFLHIVSELRAVRPDISFGSDIIVGFPSESEEDFQATLDMLEEVNFRSSFSFCYSDRPGTKASLLPNKILKEVQLERLNRLQEKQDELGAKWLQSRVGQETVLLLEQESKRAENNEIWWQGRDPHGVTVNIALTQEEAQAGRLIKARITSAKRHTLLAEKIL